MFRQIKLATKSTHIPKETQILILNTVRNSIHLAGASGIEVIIGKKY